MIPAIDLNSLDGPTLTQLSIEAESFVARVFHARRGKQATRDGVYIWCESCGEKVVYIEDRDCARCLAT
jgi:hypothetical protein